MRASAVGFWLCLALTPRPAAAGEAAAAEALFDDGVAAMQRGDYAQACPLVAESLRMEPRPGTLFTLAECRRLEGKTATALARYREYLRRFERMDDAQRQAQRGRDALAQEQVEALEADTPKLELVLEAPLPDGAIVSRDGVVLGAPSLGRPLPVDPGQHTIVITAPGYRDVEVTVQAVRTETVRVPLPRLELIPVSPPPTPEREWIPPQKQVPPPAPAPLVPPSADATGPTAWRVASYGLIGVGAASLVTGVITGAIALDRGATVREEECGFVGETCSAEGVAELDDVRRLAHVSTATLITGAVLGSAGIVLWVVEPTEPDTLSLSFGPSSVFVRGAF